MDPPNEPRSAAPENHVLGGVVSVEALISAALGLGLAGLFTGLNLALAEATPSDSPAADLRELPAPEPTTSDGVRGAGAAPELAWAAYPSQ